MDFVPRKPTTSKSKHAVKNFSQVKKAFLQEVITTVQMEEIPPELILNWDQTGIKIVPSTTWSMEKQGAKRVEVVGTGDKRQITAVFCGTIQGAFLPVQVIYAGKTERCHPKFKFPPGWHITHSPKHWSNEKTMQQYIEFIILPYVRSVRDSLEVDEQPGLIIMDNFKGQVTANINSLLEANNLHVCLLPPNTTDLLQPMDLTINKPAKSFLKNAFSQWYADQLLRQLEDHDVPLDQIELDVIDLGLPVLKELGAKWLVMMAQYIEDNPQFIVNGFIKAGISGALDDGISDSSGESALDSDELPECNDVSNSSEASDSDDNTSCDSEDHLGSLEVEENGNASTPATEDMEVEVILLSD